MTPAHAIRAALVAGATATAGDHSVLVAVITASSGVAVVVVGPIVTAWIRNRGSTAVDHRDATIAEQSALLDHYLAELAALRGENKAQENELRRLRRRRD